MTKARMKLALGVIPSEIGHPPLEIALIANAERFKEQKSALGDASTTDFWRTTYSDHLEIESGIAVEQVGK